MTTYTPKLDLITGSDFNIQKIEIEGNSILKSEKIVKKLNFLYKENLFFLDLKDIEDILKKRVFY